jgi:hypothetical protein
MFARIALLLLHFNSAEGRIGIGTMLTGNSEDTAGAPASGIQQVKTCQPTRFSDSDGIGVEFTDPEQVAVLKCNSVYRVGDLTFRSGARWQADRTTIMTSPQYEDTVLRCYLGSMRHDKWDLGGPDFQQLYSCCDGNSVKRASNSTFVIHLRLGDSNSRSLGSNSLVAKNALKQAAEYLKDKPWIKTITLVTALHFGGYQDKGSNYRYDEKKEREAKQLLKDFMHTLPLPAVIHSSANIDNDFCFMVTAPHFISPSQGMFGDLLKKTACYCHAANLPAGHVQEGQAANHIDGLIRICGGDGHLLPASKRDFECTLPVAAAHNTVYPASPLAFDYMDARGPYSAVAAVLEQENEQREERERERKRERERQGG